ncbi:enoyl-CoA hydratase/isomerase family protein [Aeromicrobium sp. CTD01-1L150]|uniref:enoyl-CoA hydratase/isomerase family protein n=1 Tax=Aeromicrobium sp. CTD01-1L150 TaxID=3341830 RepID=UPI0035BEE610
MIEIVATQGTVLARVQGARADVVLNRPEALNAMNNAMMSDIAEVFDLLADRSGIWCATLSGAGDAFCVGADQKERRGMSEEDVRRRRRLAPRAFTAMRRFPHPVIAKVHGHALGGGFELMLGCDLALLTHDASVGLIETSLGAIPGGGGTRALVTLIGPARARELIFTSRRLSGREAESMGLAVAAVPADDLDAHVEDLTQRVLANSPVAVTQAKKALLLVESGSYDDALRIEAEHYERVLTSEDRLEAVAAAREGRRPQFTGR